MTRRLEQSIAARWRTRTAGDGGRARNWQTRLGYYEALDAALERNGSPDIDVNDIVRAHRNGKLSTAYAIVTNGGLARFYRTEQIPPDRRRIADFVPESPIHQLLAETKVWSFWPGREAWLRELDERFPTAPFRTAAQRLAQVIAGWREQHPLLAATQGGLPPLCAIEDLVILGRGALSAARAVELLLGAGPAGELEFPQELGCGQVPVLNHSAIDDIATRLDTAIGLLGAGDGTRFAMGLLTSARRDLAALRRGRARSHPG
ncbi:hypothetical protein ABZ342_19590 [Amycolatopsis sp. NPDC005961]|uniref:hypothetical protein n=1 Tax=Amycolatopsis sp. NPDC005961 TaxID=3156720 RepID=UPI003406856A